MPWTFEDKIIIRHYRQNNGWGSRRIFSTLREDKDWTQSGIQKIIEKIDHLNGEIRRLPGSGRTKSARTVENIEAVQEEIFSQEDRETGEWKKHAGINKIAQKLGISGESVRRIIYHDLHLHLYHRVKCQKLNDNDFSRRVERCKRLVRKFTRRNIAKTFFSDEKVFTVEGPINPKNDVFYSTETKKADVNEERMMNERSAFPKLVMVSCAVSMLGKTSLYIIQQGCSIDL